MMATPPAPPHQGNLPRRRRRRRRRRYRGKATRPTVVADVRAQLSGPGRFTHRWNALSAALARRGVALRVDSRLARDWAAGPSRPSDTQAGVVARICRGKFLHEHTDYKRRCAGVRRTAQAYARRHDVTRAAAWAHVRRHVLPRLREAAVAEAGGYPVAAWPWQDVP